MDDEQPIIPGAAGAARTARAVLGAQVAQAAVIRSALGTSVAPRIREVEGLRGWGSVDGVTALQAAAAVHEFAQVPSLCAVTRRIDLVGSIAKTVIEPVLSDTASFLPRQFEATTAVGLAQKVALGAQIGQIVSARQSLARIIAASGGSSVAASLLATVSRHGRVQSQLAAFAPRPGSVAVVPGYAQRSGRRYDSYLRALPPRPAPAMVARYAGDTRTGSLIAESLMAPELGLDRRGELAENLDTTVLEPWQSGPIDAREDLYARLDGLASRLSEWLKAAWHEVVHNGPKAASNTAHDLEECVDRALRAGAPTKDLMAWLETIPSNSVYRTRDGKPTRVARAAFITRGRSKKDTRLVTAQLSDFNKIIPATVEYLQSAKHGDAPSLIRMRGLILAVESILTRLFVLD